MHTDTLKRSAQDASPAAFAAAELLLVPEQVLLRDGPRRGLGVVVGNGRFREIGPAEAVMARNPQLTAHQLPDTLLMPGFVDAHHHLSQAFGKAVAFGEPSEIFRRIWVR